MCLPTIGSMVKRNTRYHRPMNEELGTGLLFAPEDSRDALYAAFEEIAASHPASFELERLDFYRNQKSQPSCVYQTVARIIDYFNRHENTQVQVSARYGFAYCKALDGNPTLEGTFTKTGFDVATKIGTATNADWPDNSDLSYVEYIKRPSTIADQGAAPFRFSGYVTMLRPEEVKDYILKYRVPVSLGLNANNTAWGYNVVTKANNYTIQEPTGSRGGHLMACVGWNDRGWVIENSWGPFWGDNGRATVPYGHSGLQNAMVGGYDLPNDWQVINDNYKETQVTLPQLNAIQVAFYRKFLGRDPKIEEQPILNARNKIWLAALNKGGAAGQADLESDLLGFIPEIKQAVQEGRI